jgi:hypothetical protein
MPHFWHSVFGLSIDTAVDKYIHIVCRFPSLTAVGIYAGNAQPFYTAVKKTHHRGTEDAEKAGKLEKAEGRKAGRRESENITCWLLSPCVSVFRFYSFLDNKNLGIAPQLP